MNEPTGTQYGGFWIRFLALLADSAILYLLSAVILLGGASLLGPEILPPLLLVVWVICLLYWPVMHATGLQATVGKALLGLKVARLHGGRIGILRSIARELSKILSGAVLLVGYVMAAFTPRKQGLHDLMTATYVMRDGVSRPIPAIALVVAGFVLPFVAVPILLGDAAVAMVTNAAQAMVAEHDPMKVTQAPKAAVKALPKPAAPAPVAKAPPAPAPEPAPVAKPAPANPEPPKVEVAKVEPSVEKPAAKTPAPQPKPGPTKIVQTPRKPAAAPAQANVAAAPKLVAAPAAKQASGPKFNDLMTAVLYRDVDGVSELLKLGKWPDKRDSRGQTPLMVAVDLGDRKMAEALLRGGANPTFAMPVAEGRSDGEMISLLKRYSSR